MQLLINSLFGGMDSGACAAKYNLNSSKIDCLSVTDIALWAWAGSSRATPSGSLEKRKNRGLNYSDVVNRWKLYMFVRTGGREDLGLKQEDGVGLC
jgi:hypothetical protein